MGFRFLLRRVVHFLIGDSLYSFLRSLRKRGVDLANSLKKGLSGTQGVLIATLNQVFVLFCKVRFRLGFGLLRYEETQNFSRVIERIKMGLKALPLGTKPFLLGPIQGAHTRLPLFIDRDYDFSKKAFWRYALYQSDLLQELLRGELGSRIEEKLGARAYFFNLQLFRQAKGESAIRAHLGDSIHFGIRGIYLLRSKEFQNEDLFFLDSKSQHNPLPDSEEVDCLYFHAIPTLSPSRLCQQAGLDTIEPTWAHKPEVGTPVIEVKPLGEIQRRLQRQEFFGLNLGGGDFQKAGWLNIDTRFSLRNVDNLYPRWIRPDEPVPFKDQSLRFVYTSHFFEHVDDPTVDLCIKEAYRTLKPGGLFFVVVPDFESAHKACRNGDWSFIEAQWKASGEMGFNQWASHGLDLSLESMTAALWCSYGRLPIPTKEPSNRIPEISPEALKEAFQRMEIKEISQLLNSKIPKDIFGTVHINSFSVEELNQRLRSGGFEPIDPFGVDASAIWKELGAGVLERWKSQSLYAAGRKI